MIVKGLYYLSFEENNVCKRRFIENRMFEIAGLQTLLRVGFPFRSWLVKGCQDEESRVLRVLGFENFLNGGGSLMWRYCSRILV